MNLEYEDTIIVAVVLRGARDCDVKKYTAEICGRLINKSYEGLTRLRGLAKQEKLVYVKQKERRYLLLTRIVD